MNEDFDFAKCRQEVLEECAAVRAANPETYDYLRAKISAMVLHGYFPLTSLDDFMEELGITRADLDALPDNEE